MFNIAVGYIYLSKGYLLYDPSDLIAGAIVIILRCLIISARYGCMSENRYELQYKKIFTKQENAKDFIVSAWKDIKPDELDLEIKHAMIRSEVENSFFNIRLLAKLNEEYKDRMTNFRYYEDHKLDEK